MSVCLPFSGKEHVVTSLKILIMVEKPTQEELEGPAWVLQLY